MNINAYIEFKAKTLIKDLAQNWDKEKLNELRYVLNDMGQAESCPEHLLDFECLDGRPIERIGIAAYKLNQLLCGDIAGFIEDHQDDMNDLASRVWKSITSGELKKNQVYIFLVTTHPNHFEVLYGVYSGGAVYLGMSPAQALEMNRCRILNGKIEIIKKE